MTKSQCTRLYLDRFEGELAVLVSQDEAGLSLDLPKDLLPEGTAEGTVLTVTVAVDEDATTSGKREVETLMQELLHRDAETK
jgi:hypothetical protein